MKHITTVVKAQTPKKVAERACGECQASCQSACKTSCTIANQRCENIITRRR